MANQSARRLSIVNPDLSRSEVTQLSADYTTGTALTVLNNEVFADGDIAVIGNLGTEQAESRPVGGTTGTTQIDLDSALDFDHNNGAPVYRSEYDQIEVSHAPSGVWTVLSTLDIQWDKHKTIYIHQGGTNNSSYRFRFKNSATGDFSEYSQTVGGGGYTATQIGSLIENVRLVINDPNAEVVTDEEIIRFLNRAKNIIKAKRPDWWFWFITDEGTITTQDGVTKYNLDSISENIEYIRNVRFRDNTNSAHEMLYPLNPLTETEYDDLFRDQTDPEEDDAITDYYLELPDQNSSSGYIRCYPVPETTGGGSFYVRAYAPESDYDDVADTTAIALPKILEDYAIFRCLQIKGDEIRANVYKDLFFGPAETRKDNEDLSGIALLENMQINKGKVLGKPRLMKVYRGSRYIRKVFGNPRSSAYRDTLAEKYW